MFPAGGFMGKLRISQEWFMNSSNREKNILPKWSVLLVLVAVTAVASAQEHKQSAPAAAPRASAPSAPHAAPAQRPGGNANSAQRPGGNANRGPGGASPNNRGPANANNRGPGGASASRAGQAGANNANNRGGANANNRGGANANNRTGANNANNRGGANANNRGAANATKGGAAGANRHQPAGSKTVALKSGGKATFRKDGKVRSVQTAKGMKIEHGVHGGRRIESTHNGRKVVSMGKRGGYSQRAYYSHGGRTYVQRTYYVGGQSYAYGYSSYYYGGYPYYGYAPSYYYGPGYYGWAYNPWPAPVTYGWGWGGSPWYGYYGPYFQPYPVYPTAAFWLTDYLIAANLQAAYAAQAAESGDTGPAPLATQSADEIASLWTTDPLIAANLEAAYGPYMFGTAAPAAKGSATGLSAAVKQAIADQVKQEIAAEQAAAKGGDQKPAGGEQVPAALDPKIRYFVVSSDLDATTSDGVECQLTPGDVVYRSGDTPDDDHMVDATVKSSKKDNCAAGVSVGVETGDLQEMHNQLRIQMDAGLKTLAEKQGKDGIPAAPDTKTQAGEVPPPAPDTNVANDLQQQKKDADQAEAEAQQPN